MQAIWIRDSSGGVQAAVFATILPDGSLGLGWSSQNPAYQPTDGSNFPLNQEVASPAFDYLNQPLKRYTGYTRPGSPADLTPPPGRVRQLQPTGLIQQGQQLFTVLSVDLPAVGDILTHLKPLPAINLWSYTIQCVVNLSVPVQVGSVTYQQYRIALNQPLQAAMSPGDVCLLTP